MQCGLFVQERLNYRAIQRKLRQDLLLAKSSFPPRMESEMIRWSCLINQNHSSDYKCVAFYLYRQTLKTKQQYFWLNNAHILVCWEKSCSPERSCNKTSSKAKTVGGASRRWNDTGLIWIGCMSSTRFVSGHMIDLTKKVKKNKLQEKVARREKEAKEEELMVKSGKARLHMREVAKYPFFSNKSCKWQTIIENLSLETRKGERDRVLRMQFAADLSQWCLLSREWRRGVWRRVTTSLLNSGSRWWSGGGRRRWRKKKKICKERNILVERWERGRERREMKRSERRGGGVN